MPFLSLLGSPLTTLLGASSLALLLALGVQTFRIESFKAEVAQAEKQTADAQAQVKGIQAEVDHAIAEAAQARADNERQNAAQRLDLETKRNTLQATLNQTTADYNKVAAQLRGIISNAKDGLPISMSTRNYFDGLRLQQQQWHGNNN